MDHFFFAVSLRFAISADSPLELAVVGTFAKPVRHLSIGVSLVGRRLLDVGMLLLWAESLLTGTIVCRSLTHCADQGSALSMAVQIAWNGTVSKPDRA
jgi:hypothetical protein